MNTCETLIRNTVIFDGSGSEPTGGTSDVAIEGGVIRAVGRLGDYTATHVVDANGMALAPGFIDVHTHDDTNVVRAPEMLPKLSQGVTTVIVGNCGICAAPVRLDAKSTPPDPMNLLGVTEDFHYPNFSAYVDAVNAARPSVNVAALAGHTSLRNNHMDRLDRVATAAEIRGMQRDLQDALDHGAIGLSTGLAYLNAISATTEEVIALAEPLAAAGAIYTTHMRSETETILKSMQEAFRIGREGHVPVVISHLKCAGVDNWGRSGEVLQTLETARESQPVGCDCYPYAASSSTLDLRQVDERVKIMITWSTPHPEVGGKMLAQIAAEWGVPQLEAARALMPAGAVYHCMSEEDMRRILQHPATMIGSDGLPNDPKPHPRLWGTFPRVLGRYSREHGLFPMQVAVHKMTGLPASRFGLKDRGHIGVGYRADLVLFNPQTVLDVATFEDPKQPAAGIASVWVNGVLSYNGGKPTGERGGKFLARQAMQQTN